MIRIVAGRRDSGKSSFLRAVAAGSGAKGFLSLKVFGPDGLRGFDLLSLSSGRLRPLARSAPSGVSFPGPSWFRFRRFIFDANTFDWAREEAAEILAEASGPLILDEVGPLEVEGRGLSPILYRFMQSERELTVSCRTELVHWLCRRIADEGGAHRQVRVISLLP